MSKRKKINWSPAEIDDLRRAAIELAAKPTPGYWPLDSDILALARAAQERALPHERQRNLRQIKSLSTDLQAMLRSIVAGAMSGKSHQAPTKTPVKGQTPSTPVPETRTDNALLCEILATLQDLRDITLEAATNPDPVAEPPNLQLIEKPPKRRSTDAPQLTQHRGDIHFLIIGMVGRQFSELQQRLPEYSLEATRARDAALIPYLTRCDFAIFTTRSRHSDTRLAVKADVPFRYIYGGITALTREIPTLYEEMQACKQ